jgi:ADP-ribose pyrophosphatase
MSEDEAHWATLGEETVLSGAMTVVRRRVALPDGSEIDYDVDVDCPFAVAAFIVLDHEVVLTRQYRYPIDRWIYDLPAGGARPGETPATAVRREVEEETGLVPGELQPLHTFFQNPGRNAWPVHLFFGLSAAAGVPKTDDAAEQVRAVRMPLSELDARIITGEIVDPALLVARLMVGALGLLPPLVDPARSSQPPVETRQGRKSPAGGSSARA